MRIFFAHALRSRGVTGDVLLGLLERRLDNVVYRLGFGSSRKEARQFVKHYHFKVNGRRVNVPARILKKGDVVELVEKSKSSAKLTGQLAANSMRELPVWLELDKDKFKGTIKDLPKREDITSKIEERLVVELYSK